MFRSLRPLTIAVTIQMHILGKATVERSWVLTTTSLQFPQAFLPCLPQIGVPGVQFEQEGRRTGGVLMVAVQMQIKMKHYRKPGLSTVLRRCWRIVH